MLSNLFRQFQKADKLKMGILATAFCVVASFSSWAGYFGVWLPEPGGMFIGIIMVASAALTMYVAMTLWQAGQARRARGKKKPRYLEQTGPFRFSKTAAAISLMLSLVLLLNWGRPISWAIFLFGVIALFFSPLFAQPGPKWVRKSKVEVPSSNTPSASEPATTVEGTVIADPPTPSGSV